MSLKRPREEQDYVEELYSLIRKIELKNKLYYDSDKIIEKFKNLLEENEEGMMNCCLECGEDMGRSNPRQLCGKTYCYFK